MQGSINLLVKVDLVSLARGDKNSHRILIKWLCKAASVRVDLLVKEDVIVVTGQCHPQAPTHLVET